VFVCKGEVSINCAASFFAFWEGCLVKGVSIKNKFPCRGLWGLSAPQLDAFATRLCGSGRGFKSFAREEDN